MLIEWEVPLDKIEADFKYDHRLEAEIEISYVEYDPLAEAVILHINVEQDDLERIPESDSTGSLIRR
jgi:hypothetical protein